MAVLAQSQYTELLDNLSDKSLPLINITVGYKTGIHASYYRNSRSADAH